MKKVLLVLLALIMVLGTMTTAFAGMGNGMVPPGQAKHMIKSGMFDDIADVQDWAGDAIYSMAEKGIIKGDGYGNFLPNKPVTHGEVVTMLIRMLDLEAEVDTEASLPEWIDEEDAQEWMYGYLVMADEIFGENDGFRTMMNPNTPVKRQEIAQYITWIIENEEELSIEISDDFDLMFDDASEVDSEYLEAVKLMKHTGLMIGYNNKLQPKKPVTRAQFTLIMQRLIVDFDSDFDFDPVDNDIVIGELIDIDFDNSTPEAIEINIYNNDENDEYDLTDTAKAYDADDDEITFDDLDDDYIGNIVKLLLNDQDEVVKVVVMEVDMTEGNLEQYDYDGDDIDWIVVENEYGTEKFRNVTPGAIVFVEGVEDDDLQLEKELLDLNIELVIEDDEVVEIIVDDSLIGTLDSFIYESDDITGASIIPEFEEDEKDYDFDDSVLVKVNGNIKDLDELEEMDFENPRVKVIFDISYDDGDDEYVLLIKRLYITTD